MGHADICKTLLENGADPKIMVTINGITDTPLEAA
jgi:ankyrin repeat protein